MQPVRLIVIGAGSRGNAYSDWALRNPSRARVVAVAEPRSIWRERFAARHSLPPAACHADWRDIPSSEPAADAVLLTTPDALHVDPAVALAARGYHLLLEKPMATTAEDCRRIVEAVEQAGIICAVCHVLRYTAYTRRLKSLLDEGVVGDIVSLRHLEPVGYWHQAHSFVRGNWRNEAESAFMLLAKSCHDLDWLRHIVGSPCRSVSSFGNLKHFTPANRPAGAADRCLDCELADSCPYAAQKIYGQRLEQGHQGWPLDVLMTQVTPDNLEQTLREGPYGHCVYNCDNDVVDHQVVNLEYANGTTAAFTMTAFNRARARQTDIFGTRGEINGDGRYLRLFDFLTDRTTEIDTADEQTAVSGHGGGDWELMTAFIDAVSHKDPGRVPTGPRESLETHLTIFAAERSRLEKRTIHLPE